MNEIDFLLSIDSKKIKYGLSRTIALLDACNNPQDKLNIIQIVGTNGKGSTSAMIANALINNNYKIGLFTSPHLVYINERIRINNHFIPDEFIIYFIKKFKKKILDIKPSFFEIITVLAVYYFAIKKVDFSILETGLGGRLDSVTATRAKILIFTPIDYDHQKILGASLALITREKAGAIVQNNKLIISCQQTTEVSRLLNDKAKKENKTICYQKKSKTPLKQLQLKGVHQEKNGELAILALNKISHMYALHINNINTHIANTEWFGRIQYIEHNPDIIFDVAHNNQSINAFIEYFKTIKSQYQTKWLVFGYEEGKTIEQSIIKLNQHFNHITITETKIKNSMSPDKIFTMFDKKTTTIRIENNPKEAIKQIKNKLNKKDVMVILGSHYFGPYIHTIFKNCFDIGIKNLNFQQ